MWIVFVVCCWCCFGVGGFVGGVCLRERVGILFLVDAVWSFFLLFNFCCRQVLSACDVYVVDFWPFSLLPTPCYLKYSLAIFYRNQTKRVITIYSN